MQRIGALHAMQVVQCPDFLQLDEKHVRDQQVGAVVTGHNATVMHLDAVLLLHREASIAQFLRQGILVGLSRNPTPSVRAIAFEALTRRPLVMERPKQDFFAADKRG